MSAALIHLPGPWMVCMDRKSGMTVYRPITHTHTAIAVNREDFYLPGYKPGVDCDGYVQPDDNIDCAQWRVDVARLIAAAPDMYAALEQIAQVNEYNTSSMGWVVELAKTVLKKVNP